jgi:hypothetical protein
MKFNTDNSTNTALVLMVAIEIYEKLTGHPIPPNAKETLLEIFVGVGLWFTGKPSPTTGKILKYFGLNNALVDSAAASRSDSLARDSMGAPRDQYRDNGDVGLNVETLERMADGGDHGDRGAVPAPAARVARYWEERPPELPVVGSPTIDGTNMSGVEFTVRSTSGSNGPNGPRTENW